MNELDKLFQDADAIVDTYGSTDWSIDQLLELRRNLAGISWRIASMSKDVFAGAGMGYLGRKHAIAKHIVDARAIDAKKAINALEKEADAVPSVVAAQKQEIEAEAAKEKFKLRMEQFKHVLSSMQQDIAYLAREKQQTQHQ